MMFPKPPKKKGRHRQTIECDISPKVRQEVYDRDSIDGTPCSAISQKHENIQVAHYIGRAQGGLGVPQNLVCLTKEEHTEYDNGNKREEYGTKIRDYLMEHYPDWNEEDLIYNKYGKMPISEKNFEYAMDKAAEIVESDIR